MVKNISEYANNAGIVLKIYPSDAQKEIIRRSANAAKFVYNKMVALGKEIWGFGHPALKVDFVEERIAQLKELKKNTKLLCAMYPWLSDPLVDSNAIANAKARYQDAWNMYRKVYNIAPPNFHRKSYEEKYQTSIKYYKKAETIPTLTTKEATIRFEDKHHVVLPKLGRIRCAGSPKMLDKLFAMAEVRIGTVTIRKDEVGEYFASFQLASDEAFFEQYEKTGSEVGIDLNVDNFLTDSNGTVVDNPKFFRKTKKRLAKAKRVLGKRKHRAKKNKRKLKDSKNYQKQRVKAAKIERKTKRRRHAFLDETSTALVKNHDRVVAEELRSKNMMRNHALASSIQDVGWRKFLSMMQYKAAAHGKEFETVSPRNTTQTCNHCKHVMKGDQKLTLKDREWDCPVCKTHHVRDWNAAKNVLEKGSKKKDWQNPVGGSGPSVG